jgi:hypothetical protein
MRVSTLGSVRRLAAALGVAALPLLQSCAPAIDADDPTGGFFPMTVGTVWQYKLESDMNDDLLHERIEIVVDRQIDFDAWPTWVRRSSTGIEYYLRRDAQGVRRVATRTDVQEQAVLDAKPRHVLKLPLQVGQTWEAITVPYLLRRPNEYPRDLTQTHQATMVYRIESINASVEVPQGSHQACVLVRGEALLRLFVDPNTGFQDVPLVSREWYCPGAGLVKFEREETVPAGQFFTGGQISYVLTSLR